MPRSLAENTSHVCPLRAVKVLHGGAAAPAPGSGSAGGIDPSFRLSEGTSSGSVALRIVMFKATFPERDDSASVAFSVFTCQPRVADFPRAGVVPD